MKVISLPEIANQIRRRRSGKTLISEFINQCKIEDAIIIPDGATNGDMIKEMFPNAEYGKDELGNMFVISSAQLGYIAFRECWWNAPYKGNLSEKSTGSESEEE